MKTKLKLWMYYWCYHIGQEIIWLGGVYMIYLADPSYFRWPTIGVWWESSSSISSGRINIDISHDQQRNAWYGHKTSNEHYCVRKTSLYEKLTCAYTYQFCFKGKMIKRRTELSLWHMIVKIIYSVICPVLKTSISAMYNHVLMEDKLTFSVCCNYFLNLLHQLLCPLLLTWFNFNPSMDK